MAKVRFFRPVKPPSTLSHHNHSLLNGKQDTAQIVFLLDIVQLRNNPTTYTQGTTRGAETLFEVRPLRHQRAVSERVNRR